MKYKIKSLQFNVGTDLLGSAISMPIRKGMKAELVDSGVVLTSGNTGRIVLVPFSNIKGIELVEEISAPVLIKASKAPKS